MMHVLFSLITADPPVLAGRVGYLQDEARTVVASQHVVAAAHELAANAVRHGAGHGQLRLWAVGRSLHCQVSDPGRAAQASTRPDAPAWCREHGHGLWMMDQLADKVTLDSGPAGTITFIISSPASRTAAPDTHGRVARRRLLRLRPPRDDMELPEW